MKRTMTLILAVMMTLSLLSFCAVSANAASQEFPKMKFQIAHGDPTTDNNNYHKLAVLFSQKVTAATNGAITFEILGNNQLGNEFAYTEGMLMGTIDMAILTSNGFSDLHKQTGFYDIPFLFESDDEANAYMLSDVNKAVTDTYPDQLGLHVLGWGEGGFRCTFNNGISVKSMADYKGLKLRMPGTASFTRSFSALGANPTPMAYSETFTGLSQGAIDGILLPILTGYSGRYHEVCKYLTVDKSFYNALCVAISSIAWEKLTPELQRIFISCAEEAGKEQIKFVQSNEQGAINAMREHGTVVVEDFDTTGIREVLQPMYDATKAKIGAKIYDASMAWLEQYRANN